jgi:hypothetical protein
MYTKALALVLLLAVSAASADSTASFDETYTKDLTVAEPADAQVTQPRIQL